MKIISWNVNGLRAAQKRGFGEWLKKSRADIVCLQEIKCGLGDIPKELKNPSGFLSFYNPAVKKGYAGVAVFTKQTPLKAVDRLSFKGFDEQGRILRLDFPKFTLLNLYMPHGGRGKEKLGFKLKAYEKLLGYLKNLDSRFRSPRFGEADGNDRKTGYAGREILLVGDFNIVHEEIDLARPKQNKNNIMFTPEERTQIDALVELGFVDSFRKLHPNEQKFTWWPYYANARTRNLGWRIDYAFVSKNLAGKIKKAEIQNQVFGSDHCPIGIELK